METNASPSLSSFLAIQVARDEYLAHADHCPDAQSSDTEQDCPECRLLLSRVQSARSSQAQEVRS